MKDPCVIVVFSDLGDLEPSHSSSSSSVLSSFSFPAGHGFNWKSKVLHSLYILKRDVCVCLFFLIDWEAEAFPD